MREARGDAEASCKAIAQAAAADYPPTDAVAKVTLLDAMHILKSRSAVQSNVALKAQGVLGGQVADQKNPAEMIYRLMRGTVPRAEVGLEEERVATAVAREQLGDAVVAAINGDISKLILKTSRGVLSNASLEDAVDEATMILHATLYPPDAEPLEGYWSVQVDEDGFVWLQRVNDNDGEECDDVFDVCGVGCLQ